MSDVRINTRSPYYIEANPTEPTVPETPTIPDPPANTPPTVTIVASNENPYEGETVTLTAVATDSDGTIVSYLWGGTSSPQTTVSIDVTSSTVQSKVYNVAVTDDDGDVGIAQITINWQEIPQPTTNTDIGVACGDIFNQANFNGIKNYNLLVGDKIGDVTITFQDTVYSPSDVPIKFTLEWDGNTATTGYIGDDSFDVRLQANGVSPSDINTSSPSNKASGTTLTINKTAATPNQVTLKAQSVLMNDSYTFRLDCPDVEAVETTYYTIKGNSPETAATFTYTNASGDSVTRELSAEDAPELISAQTGTVSVTGDGTIEEGGQSFDLGVPEQEYDENTEIVIIIDDSGSMADTQTQIQAMADGILKDKLIDFYGGDLSKYQEKVKVISANSFNVQYLGLSSSIYTAPKERFLRSAAHGKINQNSTRSIYMYFQDEASGTGIPAQGGDSYQRTASTDFYDTATTTYSDDLSLYRAFLDSVTYGEHFMKFFIVSSDYDYETIFLQNIFSGYENFHGSNGLSDRSEVSSVGVLNSGVTYSSNPNYYYDYVIQALQDYGFNI